MNSAIKTLLSSGTSEFNHNIIIELINVGATFCSKDNEFNTFSVAFHYSENDIRRSPLSCVANRNVDLIDIIFLCK